MPPNVILNLFNVVQFAHARHSSSKLGSALAQSQISGSHCEPILMLHRGQMLKRVQHDHQLWSFVFCDIEEHKKQVIEWSQTSRLITHNSQLKNMFFCSSVKKWICVPSSTFVKIQEKGILAFLIK